ncbi:MAG: exodeoxyribonuclease V subunit alpha [Chlorobium sp.]|uniref:exodeoxyribonuclease V subunit alpha n=1 Tax=Chlorobium sp. TaxID=1095 RepID=UPI0025BA90D9|nr:exodeoxyribonuclease V subunit alpha [Chlorobium sp.]MCF8216644.1 exodeoxyribonuclease V subunit alpha [Chlorobium sp.]MCF8271514.1 exodeoxyribonuclease V subunit alpha [Chlorobium sp.]MCF8287886.1 exodeoxyribonuclease V subunit alpha [Chlorobium sp.]MCF8291460.1 exodeoxyribonuclease V subunit alpha [Chlorobium sp.]MCF8385555.1 exodeoxyribonuclease V subunit alpha [Chlorobium sp.]
MIDFIERSIDRQASTFLCRGARDESGVVRTVVSLLSQAVGQGHVCLDLEEIAGQPVRIPGREEPLRLPGIANLLAALRSLPTVGRPGEHRPLILDEAGRLYLYRYFRYELQLAEAIRARAAMETGSPDEAAFAEQLDRYFVPDESGEDRQRQAALTALRRGFSVISGGPGTGKTTTVVRILGLMLEQPDGERMRIAMAAPTGKAAARLASSIASLRETLPCSEAVKHTVPSQVTTIHRLLGTIPNSTGFRHNARNPLPYDTVIVDEASMVDLPLMTALVTALMPQAHLILIGDRDQLASVEAGAVLGDICRAAESSGSAVEGCVTVLDRNYRFGDGSGIAALSRAINNGDAGEAIRLLTDTGFSPAISLEATPMRETVRKRLASPVLEGFRPYLEAETPEEALRLFERFRILTALREGPWGAAGMNHAVETLLHEAGLLKSDSLFYRGRPVLVTENDYIHKLFNGDTGIILPDPETGNQKAYFAAPDGTVRSIPPEFLPTHVTAFAMTVHKSQGSEFDRVLMVLPPEDTLLLTRELIYTGITRARQAVTLWSDDAVFSVAVKRRTERRSGLREMLVNKQ